MSFAYLEFLLVNAFDCDFVFFGAAALPLAALPLAAFWGVVALPLDAFAGSETDGLFSVSPTVAESGAELVMTVDFSETEIFPFCSTTTT